MKLTLEELARLTNSSFEGDPLYSVEGVQGLETATPLDLSFFANARYVDLLSTTKAGIICISPETPRQEGKNYLIAPSPSAVFQSIVEYFKKQSYPKSGFNGIHPSACIHPTANVHPSAHVGPYAVVDAHTVVQEHCTIGAHVFIGAGSLIGSHTTLYPHVTIREGCQIGNHVTIHSGSVIGSAGFGFTTSSTGTHTRFEHYGSVVIEDNVTIGSSVTIDRARFETTIIGEGTQIDNLVQIAHNVKIGKRCVIVAQTGIAGSTTIGDDVVIGGQSGIVGHISICNKAVITARGGVSKSITEPGVYRGEPVMPITEYQRLQVFIRKLPTLFSKIKNLTE